MLFHRFSSFQNGYSDYIMGAFKNKWDHLVFGDSIKSDKKDRDGIREITQNQGEYGEVV